jgi:predicted GTPase
MADYILKMRIKLEDKDNVLRSLARQVSDPQVIIQNNLDTVEDKALWALKEFVAKCSIPRARRQIQKQHRIEIAALAAAEASAQLAVTSKDGAVTSEEDIAEAELKERLGLVPPAP